MFAGDGCPFLLGFRTCVSYIPATSRMMRLGNPHCHPLQGSLIELALAELSAEVTHLQESYGNISGPYRQPSPLTKTPHTDVRQGLQYSFAEGWIFSRFQAPDQAVPTPLVASS